MAVHGRHRWQGGRFAPVTSRGSLTATSVGFTMAVCAPSGRGQHGRGDDRDGAGTPAEAAAGRDDRTNGSTSLLAGAPRPEKRRRARSPSRRPPADHPPAAGVNRDASLFFCAPETDPSERHASAGRDGSADSVCPHPGASGDAPVRRNRCHSRSARGHSSCTRPPGSDTARTGTDGQPLARPAHRRRLGVDERHPWQDTRPAFVPSTVWGTASRQNCQVMVGAVLAPQFWQASDTLPRHAVPPARRPRQEPHRSGSWRHGLTPRHACGKRRLPEAGLARTAAARNNGETGYRLRTAANLWMGLRAQARRAGRNDVSGSTSLSGPGSITVSAEAGGDEPHDCCPGRHYEPCSPHGRG